MVTALRSLLRFLHVDGLIDQPLVRAVPSVAAWKLAGLPKALDAAQVSALLASCDKATVVGRRDYAILVVLARLGLRAGEGEEAVGTQPGALLADLPLQPDRRRQDEGRWPTPRPDSNPGHTGCPKYARTIEKG
jgi:hypothetical protein